MRVSPIVLTLLCPICVASPPPPPPGGGCNASTLEGMNIVGSSDIVHFPSESAAECAASCCTLQRQRCLAYTWTSWQPHTTPQCVQHTKCCWLKAEAGMTAPQHNCTSGRPGAWTSTPPLQCFRMLMNFPRSLAPTIVHSPPHLMALIVLTPVLTSLSQEKNQSTLYQFRIPPTPCSLHA